MLILFVDQVSEIALMGNINNTPKVNKYNEFVDT